MTAKKARFEPIAGGTKKKPKAKPLSVLAWMEEASSWARARQAKVSFTHDPYTGGWAAVLHFTDAAGPFIYEVAAPDAPTGACVEKLFRTLDGACVTARRARKGILQRQTALVHRPNYGWGLEVR